MRVLAVIQGWYGERMVRHTASLASRWDIHTVKIGKGLPPLIEGLRARSIASGLINHLTSLEHDIILFLGEEEGAFLLLPELARRLEVGAVIVPVDDYSVLPRGLERQLSDELEEIGVRYAFPRPFCSLSGGEGPISVFSELFGAPRLEIALDGGVIKAVEVLRGSPCGSTHYVARRLIGVKAEEAPYLAGIYAQIYPCLASHVGDPLIGESMIHVSASIAKAAVERAILMALSRRAQAHGAG